MCFLISSIFSHLISKVSHSVHKKVKKQQSKAILHLHKLKHQLHLISFLKVTEKVSVFFQPLTLMKPNTERYSFLLVTIDTKALHFYKAKWDIEIDLSKMRWADMIMVMWCMWKRKREKRNMQKRKGSQK